MQNLLPLIIAFVVGLGVGGGLIWLVAQGRFAAERQLSDNFKALASDALRQSNDSFMQLAESRFKQTEQANAATLDKKSVALDEMIKPMRESLQKMDTQLQALEVKREGAYRELLETVKLSNEAQQMLRSETSQLLQALRTPTSRGQWGEMQLRRILEMTGMTEYARDFSAQGNLAGGTLRPDYIINLPNGRCIIIDSKAPLTAFMDAMHSADETARQGFFTTHARLVREHVKALGAKNYWEQAGGSPELVLLFMPGDHFLHTALEKDTELMEYALTHKVLLTTPASLVGVLKSIAYGWRQESLNENARQIGALGGDLYAALFTMTEHITKLGKNLSGGLDSYNQMIGSLERNVLSKARKIKDLGAGKDGKVLPDAVEPLNVQTRQLSLGEAPVDDGAAEDAA